MLEKFIVGGYRGLQDLEFTNLKKINILVGPNNCGKTSLLEAIILSGLFDDIDLLVDTLVSRYHGLSTEYFESMFPLGKEPIICLKSQLSKESEILHTHLTFRKEETIKLDENQVARTYHLFELVFSYSYDEIDKNDSFIVRFKEVEKGYEITLGRPKERAIDIRIPCKFISFSRFDRSQKLLEDLDKILDLNQRQELIDTLKIFDEDIINFELVGKDRVIKIFKKEETEALSLYDYGNGMYKAFFIATSALLSQNGILLIDEIEAGIHSRALIDFLLKLIEVCQKNCVQIFLTTHSLEAIDIILQDCKERLDDTAIYHIKKGTKVKRYSGQRLLSLRNEIGFDVR